MPSALVPDRTVPLAPAVLVGVAAAGAATLLLQAPPVWLALIAIGLLVLGGALVSADAKLYWLAIFLAAVPLNITKLFFWTPDDVAVIKRAYGIYINENLVPQMYLADLPLAMLLGLWLAEIVSRRRGVEVPRPFVAMAAFMAWCVATVVREDAPLLGAAWTIYELKLIVMCLWFVNAGLDRRAVRLAIGVLLVSLALQSAVTGYTYVAQTGEDVWGGLFGARQSRQEERFGPARGSGAGYVFETGSLRRGTGTIGTANLEAKYFVLLLPLALAGALAAPRATERVAAFTALAAGCAALYLTYSRGGLLAAAVALALVPIVLARRGTWRRRTAALAVVAGLVAIAAATPAILGFLGSRPTYTRTRFDHLVFGLQLWWRNPIAGVGMNNFNLHVSPIDFDGTFSGAPIHNHYLRVAIETGLIGFLLYFGFFAGILARAYRLTVHADRFVAVTAAALFAGLAATAIYWYDDLFYDPIIRTQLWVTVSLVFVLGQIARRQQPHGARAGGAPASE